MIVGVDVGTSVTKARLIARDGTGSPTHNARSTLHYESGARVEQDLDEVIDTVVTVVRAAVADARKLGEPIEALAITGQGDGLWLRDGNGHAVGRQISWLDGRAAPILEQWAETGITTEVYRRTGSGMFPGSAGPLLAHLAEHEPERLARADVAGYCVDAIVQRFTGARTVDASDASLPFLDVPGRAYAAEALEMCGIGEQRRLLAEPAAPGALFALGAEAAALLDLPSGLPVTAGPFDIPACGFGCGLSKPGDGNLIIGTTLASQVLTEEVNIDPSADPAGMWLATPYPEKYLRVMPAMVGTAGLDWLLQVLRVQLDELDTLLAASPAGANGVSALPFLSPSGERAPFVDARARGQLTGLSVSTARADLVRALCEAVAFSARHCLDTLGHAGELSACGGGARSAQWSQIFADVIGTDLHIPADDSVGVRGAAQLAWEALGDPVDAAGWRAERTVVRANPANVEFYERCFAGYHDTLDLARTSWTQRSG
ncbi:xylulokinase/erythritol kinase [Tamaricihabitans halophyticus]|uniref:Xylulokinase/erythritol kinase n=1 Tax=Tamaricihabitans halophyticus TaxID=1262583 RepID=A0A4R2R5N8_9PSEU|nr:FGGY-family carbohydrate kinase [Tamaricihabitans halophyticus]TCP57119.1 xylulokinase/erythritol kinase [Tamaricihabitans halophyticus]